MVKNASFLANIEGPYKCYCTILVCFFVKNQYSLLHSKRTGKTTVDIDICNSCLLRQNNHFADKC